MAVSCPVVELDEAICKNGYGLCIYDSLIRLKEVVDTWQRDWDEHEERKPGKFRDKYATRRVRVTWQKGLEFTGPLEPLP